MKYPFSLAGHRALALALVACPLVLAGIGQAAVSFSVTPPVVSSTYTGTVTFSITGLTNGESVAIQKFVDANGNGVIDPGEPMVDAFKLTDGAAFVIGGVTNINIPFDRNAATGAITASISIAPPRSLASLIGQFIFRVLSPVQNFSPIESTFRITNALLAQSVSGVIYSNGVTPFPGAVVAILGGGGGNWVGGAVADSNGHFQVNLNPGSYTLLPTMPGFFTDQRLAGQVTLTNGQTAVQNLFLTNAMLTISGNVSDSGSGKPLGGLPMPISGGNYFALTFTDTNGNYTLGVAPATWKVKVEGQQLSTRGYLMFQNKIPVDTTTGSVANVNIAVPRGNALFYGTFTTSDGAPMANISVSAQDDIGQYEANGITDAAGNFCLAVLGGPSQWFCSPDNSSAGLASYIISSTSSTNLNAGQTLRLNFSAVPATAQISGHVQTPSGPVANLGVIGNTTINGIQYNAYADTDASGHYSFSAAAGQWSVFANCCGSDGLENFNLTEIGQETVNIPPTNVVVNITLYPYGTPALTSTFRNGSSFGFGFQGAPGTNYTIQYSTNLASTTWFTLLVTNSQNNFQFIQDNGATNGQRFYRAKISP